MEKELPCAQRPFDKALRRTEKLNVHRRAKVHGANSASPKAKAAERTVAWDGNLDR